MLGTRQDAITPLRQFLVIGPAQHHAEGLAATAHQAGTNLREGPHAGNLAHRAAQAFHHLRGCHLALTPILEEYDRHAGVHFLAAAKTAWNACVDALQWLIFAQIRRHRGFQLLHLLHAVVVTGAFRPLERDEKRTAILRRRQFTRHHAHQCQTQAERAEHEQREQQRHAAGAFDLAAIAAGESPQLTVDPADQAAGMLLRAYQLGGHHRRERQRDEGRYRDGGGQRHGEFAEQAAGVALHEADRQEHGHQHRGGGDDRKGHLPGAANRRHQRWLAEVAATLDVLQHHDGIVHHQADAQHQCEQGQQVDREAECIQRDEGRDEAHRHGYRRHHCGTETAQEQEDHHQHQRHRLGQRPVHALHGSLDEHGVVEGREDVDAFGQRALDFLCFRTCGACHVQRIGGGCFHHAQAEIVLPVAAVIRAAFGRGALHRRHIAESYQIAIVAFAQHQRGEIIRFQVGAGDAQGEVAFG